jgi:hypothetical protein
VNDLEFFAFFWLRFEKRCPAALVERSPRYGHGQPDVLGITHGRHLLEIEVKRSLADFKANFKKLHFINRKIFIGDPRWPRQFWFLVPYAIVDKIEPMVPDWAGLLRGPGPGDTQQLYSVRQAPVNRASEKLSALEVARLIHCMSNQMYSQASSLRGFFRREECDWGLDYRI